MATPRDAIQAQLIAARRNQILDAATKVFAEKGFHRASVRAIARTAGISDGTIYNYFDNKTALLVGILNRLNQTEEREEHFRQEMALEGEFKDFLVAYLRQRMALLWPNIEVFKALLPEVMVNQELRELYYEQMIGPSFVIAERYFQLLVDQGQLRPIDVPLTVRTLASTLFGLLMMQILGDEEVASRWEELPEVIATMIVEGLGNGKGVSDD
jgi:TetR/AcrR family fatty acid metabolism transcriptional regulator